MRDQYIRILHDVQEKKTTTIWLSLPASALQDTKTYGILTVNKSTTDGVTDRLCSHSIPTTGMYCTAYTRIMLQREKKNLFLYYFKHERTIKYELEIKMHHYLHTYRRPLRATEKCSLLIPLGKFRKFVHNLNIDITFSATQLVCPMKSVLLSIHSLVWL